MAEPHLEHQTVKIKDLIQQYHDGRLVIPEFQRDYVWRKGKAPKLVESLYMGFPISSLLVWQSATDVRSRHNGRSPFRSSVTNWLIDGQQRVITLARTMTGSEGIRVVFNPTSNEFRLADAATRRNPEWLLLAEIWDDAQFRRLRKNFDSDGATERTEARIDRVRRILDYEVPIVRMVDHSFEDAVQAFARINTLGVKLKTEDIESAQIAAKHSGFIVDNVAPFLKSLHDEGFNRINIMHLFRACAFVATPDGRNRTPLHQLEKQKVLHAWNKTETATRRAIDLIKRNLGLVNMDVLWSGAPIVPVISICATIPAKDRNSNEMVGWLALATLLHRYSRASDTALEQDMRACREADPIGGLLKNLRQSRPNLGAIPNDFGGSLSDRGGLFALYIACLNRGIKDFYTGEGMMHQRDLNRHHILARGQFSADIRYRSDTISNIAFILGEVNKSLGQSGPEVYLKKITKRVLESQCIPLDSELWRIDRAAEFWTARRGLLAKSFNDFVKTMLPSRHLGGI